MMVNRYGWVLLFVLSVAGCASPGFVDHSQAQLPSASVSKNVTSRVSVQLEVSGIRTENKIDLDIDGTDYPDHLIDDFSLGRVTVEAVMQALDHPKLGIRARAGLSGADYELRLMDEQGNRFWLSDDFNYGPRIGVEMAFPMERGFALVLHATMGLHAYHRLADYNEAGASLRYSPTENVELFAGWSYFSFYQNFNFYAVDQEEGHYYSPNRYDSSIEISNAGFAYGLRYKF